MIRTVHIRYALVLALLGSFSSFTAAQTASIPQTLPQTTAHALARPPEPQPVIAASAADPASGATLSADSADSDAGAGAADAVAAPADTPPDSAPASVDPADGQGSSSSSQASSSVSAGSDRNENAIDRHLLSTFFRDEYHIWTGPFHAGNYDSHTMKKYGIPFLIISGASIATDRYTAKWLPNTKDQVLWSGRVSQIGAPYTLAGFAAGTLLAGHLFHNDHAQESGLLALEALAHAGIVVEVLKEVTQRARPVDTTHGTGWWQGGASFPSGHAISSFAVATVFAYEYHDHIIVPITAYSLATIVALSRMGAREHWVSDLFVGSTMGFMMGRYVYKQHHDPELPGSLPVRRSTLARLKPDFGVGSAGPGFYWNF